MKCCSLIWTLQAAVQTEQQMFKDRLDCYQILMPELGISLCQPRSVGRPREGDSSNKL